MATVKSWSERFKAYLEAHGLTGLEAAIALRVSPSVVHYWLNGSTPREKTQLAVQRWTKGEVRADVRVKSAS